MLVFQNKETTAILVYKTSPLGAEISFYVKIFFCFGKPIWRLVMSENALLYHKTQPAASSLQPTL